MPWTEWRYQLRPDAVREFVLQQIEVVGRDADGWYVVQLRCYRGELMHYTVAQIDMGWHIDGFIRRLLNKPTYIW